MPLRHLLTTAPATTYGVVRGSHTKQGTEQGDDDVDRANTLMALYDIRAKLKDQDSSRNLGKLREKIAALHAKQTLAEKKDGDAARTKFSYPKTS